MIPANSARLVVVDEQDDRLLEFGHRLLDAVPMYTLSNSQYRDISDLFRVERGQVDFSPHPLESQSGRLSIEFLRGINIPPAVATYLNNEFYRVPEDLDRRRLHYSMNRFASVTDDRGRDILYLTTPNQTDQFDAFLAALKQRSREIHYVMMHPEIQFMIRPEINYRTAKANLQNGYRPAL